MKRYIILAGNSDHARGWRSFWCELDDRAEAIEYAEWLVKMPLHAPEAKADWFQIIDTHADDDGTHQSRIIAEGERKAEPIDMSKYQVGICAEETSFPIVKATGRPITQEEIDGAND